VARIGNSSLAFERAIFVKGGNEALVIGEIAGEAFGLTRFRETGINTISSTTPARERPRTIKPGIGFNHEARPDAASNAAPPSMSRLRSFERLRNARSRCSAGTFDRSAALSPEHGSVFDPAEIMEPVRCDVGATAFYLGMCRSFLRDRFSTSEELT
jgi:hypothetical protein